MGKSEDNKTKAKTAIKASGKGSGTKAKKGKSAGGKGDPVSTFMIYMAQMHGMDITEVPESELLEATGYARTDSTGYRKATKELTKNLGYVVKAGKGAYTLTEKGLKWCSDNGKIIPAPKTNKEHQAQLKEKLDTMVKAPQKAKDAMWAVFLDGQAHTREEVLEAGGYKRTDSTGYRNFMKYMNKMELLEKVEGSFKFSDKFYKFGGRP